MRNGKILAMSWISAFLISFTACSAGRIDKTPIPDTESLSFQVNRLWQARLEKDAQTTYLIMSTQYQKEISRDKHASKKKFDITGFQVRDVRVDGKGTGSSLVVFKSTKMGMPMEFSVRDQWIWENNSWRLSSPKRTPFDKKKAED